MRITRTIGTAVAGGTLVLGGFAVGLTLPAGAQEAPAEDQTTEEVPCERGFGFHRDGEDLAAQLGITVEELQAAGEAAHEQVVAELGELTRPEERPTTDEEREALRAQMEERRAAFEAALAGQLGISVEELDAAQLRVVEARLAEAVANGRLTQERADEILEAVRTGERPVFPGGPGRHGRFGGGPGGPGGPGGFFS